MPIDNLILEQSLSSARCWCGSCVGSDAHVCPACDTPYHNECWDSIEGCATYGCKERGKVLDELALDFKMSLDFGIVIPDSGIAIPGQEKQSWIQRWYASIRKRVGLRDDSWIDPYMDSVRASLKGITFTQLSDRRLTPPDAIGFCEGQGAVLASAEERAFYSVLTDSEYDIDWSYTRTFCFGFREGGDSFVAYDEVPHDEWLFLMHERHSSLSKGDPIVSSALARSFKDGRVVPAEEGSGYHLYSCDPDNRGSSDFDKDVHNRAILQRAAQPWGLMRCRKGFPVTSYRISASEVVALSGGRVIARPLRLGGSDCSNIINVGAYDYSDDDGRVLGVASAKNSARSKFQTCTRDP